MNEKVRIKKQYLHTKTKSKKEQEENNVLTQQSLDEETLQHIAGNGKIELCLHNPRSKSGIQTWELKIKMPDGKRKIAVVRDYGFEQTTEEIAINRFKTRAERNAEIYRLYHEQGLSQIFLANLFNISQPSVSLIVNAKIK